MGKKSGPLAFLNKKGWHPGNQRNQEKVWKREQEALKEQKQVEELRKQYDEQRQKEEVEAMAVAAGVKKKDERLDWMYQGGMVAKQEAEKRADAQLLGEKEVELQAEEEPSKAEELAQLPTFYTADTPASANEMWQRLHGDPMFAIKQQELMARKKIVANPVQMDAIKRSLMEKAQAKAARKAAKAEAKAAKKAAKKAKKEKKAKKSLKAAASSSESESSDSLELPATKRARTEVAAADSIPHRNGHGNGSHRESRPNHHGNTLDGNHEHASNGRHTWANHNSRRQDNGDRSRDRMAEDRRDHGGHSHKERANGSERDRKRSREDRDGDARPPPEHRVHHDAACVQSRDLAFGINYAARGGPEDRSSFRQETEKRLEEAARRKAAEEKEKAEQRHRRTEYKAGKLTEEEKARRLAEMSGNADLHEEARWARLQAARKRDDSEAAVEAAAVEKAAAANAAPGGRHRDTANFLSQATKDVFGGADASLADRVSRRKYYNDRNRDEDAGAFRR